MQAFSVLIVEDEVLVALMLEEALIDSGFFRTIGIYRSGTAALDHLEREQPDLLVLDLVLQGELSGIDVACAVRKFWSGPIVFHTSVADAEVRRQISAIANSAVVLKPNAASELVPAINRLLGVSLRSRQA